MNSRMPAIVALGLLLMGAVSCDMRQSAPRETIPLVYGIISDTQSEEFSMLNSVTSENVSAGSVYILDEPSRCFQLSESMLDYDAHDNFSASAVQDHLPDFAGERLCSIIDLKYSPYVSYAEAGNSMALRELAVRLTLSAISPDLTDSVLISKPWAKVVVLSSPMLCAAKFDVDTLLQCTGSSVSVISSLEASFSHFFDTREGAFNLGVIFDSRFADASVYSSAFAAEAARRGDAVSQCVSVQNFEGHIGGSPVDSLFVPSEFDVLKAFLDHYFESGNRAPLSALLIDDWNVNPVDIQSSYDEIMAGSSEEDAFYRQLLAKNFEISDSRTLVSDVCYQLFRKKNLFTHNISYPVASAFVMLDSDDGFTVRNLNVGHLSDALSGFLITETPDTFRAYVQDQHITGGN